MNTGEYDKRSTNSKEWKYFNEGNAHMIFANNNQDPTNEYQDKLCVCEKQNTGCYLTENMALNAIFDKYYNKHVLRNENFGKFITKQRKCHLEGENNEEFMTNLQKCAEGLRRKDRCHAFVDVNSTFTLEKNLFYVSPMMSDVLKSHHCKLFFVELKPKCCFDEIPSFEEIKGYIDANPEGKDVDANAFYNKYFKDCKPSERKFVFRKLVAAKEKVFSDFNTADLYSKNGFIRTRALKALLKNDWGYIKILDDKMNMIPHKDILKFFQQWDSQFTFKTLSEVIARSLDFELIKYVKGLQRLFPFYSDRLNPIKEKLDYDKDNMDEEIVDKVMGAIAKQWGNRKRICFDLNSQNQTSSEKTHGKYCTFDQSAKEAGLSENDANYLPLVAFLVSLTSRDSSFLLRVGMSRDDGNFNIRETWEEGVKISEHTFDVKFKGATPIETNKDPSVAKLFNIIADHVEKKFKNCYKEQGVAVNLLADWLVNDKNNEGRKYFIKSRANLIDVGLKPWNKVNEVVEKNYEINKDFVNYFLAHPETEREKMVESGFE